MTRHCMTILLLALLCGACDKSQQTVEDTTPDDVEAASDDDSVTRADLTGAWVLKRLGDRDALPGTTLEVSGGAITGSGGCNSYTSSYAWEGDTLKVSDIGSTEIACEGDIMTQESDFFDAVTAVTSATLDEDTLTLEGGKGTLVFGRAPEVVDATIASGAWTLDTIYDGESAATPLAGSVITVNFGADGKFSGDLGCNQATGTYEVPAEGTFGGQTPSFKLSDVTMTERACAGDDGPAKMTQESTVASKMQSATLYRIEGKQLTLIAEGKPVLRFSLLEQ